MTSYITAATFAMGWAKTHVRHGAGLTAVFASLYCLGLGWLQSIGSILALSVVYISASQILPALVRLAVFKIAVLQESSLGVKFLLNCWQSWFNQGGVIIDRKPLDPSRAASFCAALKNLGAREINLIPSDKEASIYTLYLSFADFKKSIEEAGGTLFWEMGKHIVRFSSNPSPVYEAMKRFWPQQENGDFVIFNTQGESLPHSLSRSCIVFSPFGHLLGMHKGMMHHMLGAGFDICAFNHRGTPPSTGSPSEGGFYNDLAAVCKYLQKYYTNKQLWTFGECGGTLAPAWLNSQAEFLGINHIAAHPPASLEHVVKGIPPVARWVFNRYSNHLMAAPKLYPTQNLFNVLQQQIPEGPRGHILIGTTPGDTMTPKNQTDAILEHYKTYRYPVISFTIPAPEQGDPHRADASQNHQALMQIINAIMHTANAASETAFIS